MIRLENVTKKFDKQVAVNNLSLNVQSGEFCILLGESGCGKSTTLRMINRLITPNKGEIFIRDKNIMDYNVEQLRRDIGYVVQNVGLFPHMNVQNNIAIVPKLLKWDSRKILNRTKELIELVGLDVEKYLSKYPSELSGGEAQRIGVARALAADPDIILMDEPFGAVDPLNRTKLQNEFLNIQRKLNKTVIFVTHDIDEAMKLGDRIAVMSNGFLKCYETPGNMLKNGQNDFVKKFMGKDSYINVLTKYIVADYVENSDNKGSGNYIQEDVTLKFALAEMIEQSVDSLLVKSKSGRIVGMITASQIVKVLKGDIDE